MSNKKYYRRLIVRTIEDAIILMCMGIGIALICCTVSQIFKLFNLI